jgi:hypothetical protein
MPDPTTTRKVTNANVLVTANAPVGEPIQGIIPNRFNARTKKNNVHKKGTNLSAS